MLGLYEAVTTFDPDRGRTFASWATMVMKRNVREAVRQADHPHLSAADFEARPRVLAALELGSDEEIAEHADVPVAFGTCQGLVALRI